MSFPSVQKFDVFWKLDMFLYVHQSRCWYALDFSNTKHNLLFSWNKKAKMWTNVGLMIHILRRFHQKYM